MSFYSRSPSASPNRDFNNVSDEEGDDRRSTHSSTGTGNRDDEEEGAGHRRTSDPENSEDEEERKKREKEKKKANKPKGPVRRQMISEDMLSGSKGLSKLDESFKDFKFEGKGREKEDLDRMLNKIEEWVHTLHPKHPFEQCLERIEYLGIKKKVVKTYVKKMRMGLLPMTSAETVDQVFDDDDDMFPQFDDEGQIIPDIPEQREPTNNASDDIPDEDDELELVQRNVSPISTPTPTPQPSSDNGDIPSFEEQMQLEEDLMMEM